VPTYEFCVKLGTGANIWVCVKVALVPTYEFCVKLCTGANIWVCVKLALVPAYEFCVKLCTGANIWVCVKVALVPTYEFCLKLGTGAKLYLSWCRDWQQYRMISQLVSNGIGAKPVTGTSGTPSLLCGLEATECGFSVGNERLCRHHLSCF